MRFIQALQTTSEQNYNHYVMLRHKQELSMIPNIATGQTTMVSELKDFETPELKTLYELCNEHDEFALCVSPQSIVDRFKFGGVVLNYSTDNMVQGPGVFEHTDHYQIMNGIVSGLAEVHDVFTPSSEMRVGAKLYLHIYRRESKTLAGHIYGAFVVDPRCSATNGRPNVMHTYRDLSDTSSAGLLEEIGDVHYNKDREDSHKTQLKGSGMEPTLDLDSARRSTLMLAKITITLNKRK
jgi:hypothetical protein